MTTDLDPIPDSEWEELPHPALLVMGAIGAALATAVLLIGIGALVYWACWS